MRNAAKSGSRAQISAVVRRAEGTVEDWGRVVHASDAERIMYVVTHPALMTSRWKWRLKQWYRGFKTRG